MANRNGSFRYRSGNVPWAEEHISEHKFSWVKFMHWQMLTGEGSCSGSYTAKLRVSRLSFANGCRSSTCLQWPMWRPSVKLRRKTLTRLNIKHILHVKDTPWLLNSDQTSPQVQNRVSVTPQKGLTSSQNWGKKIHWNRKCRYKTMVLMNWKRRCLGSLAIVFLPCRTLSCDCNYSNPPWFNEFTLLQSWYC